MLLCAQVLGFLTHRGEVVVRFGKLGEFPSGKLCFSFLPLTLDSNSKVPKRPHGCSDR